MNIIVTGGAGFIGSNFVFHMLKAHPDYRIICVDKLTYAGNLSTLKSVMDNPNFRFCKIDICDREAIYKLTPNKNIGNGQYILAKDGNIIYVYEQNILDVFQMLSLYDSQNNIQD